MSKQIILRFNKPDLWEEFVSLADVHTRKDAGDIVYATIEVTSYQLADHQFLQAKFRVGGKALTILIPRSIIVTVIEREGSFEKVGFDFTRGAEPTRH